MPLSDVQHRASVDKAMTCHCYSNLVQLKIEAFYSVGMKSDGYLHSRNQSHTCCCGNIRRRVKSLVYFQRVLSLELAIADRGVIQCDLISA